MEQTSPAKQHVPEGCSTQPQWINEVHKAAPHPDPSRTSHLDLQDVSLMGRPTPHDKSCPGVQQHNETRGEASHNTAPVRTDSQAADEPSAHPAGQAKLMLQERESSYCWSEDLGDPAFRGQGPAGFHGGITAGFGPAMITSLSTRVEQGGSQTPDSLPVVLASCDR